MVRNTVSSRIGVAIILMVYGCGSVGLRTARLAKEAGVDTVMGGRDAARVAAAAGPLGLEWRTSMAADADALSRLLQGVRVLVNTAGPFTWTAPALARACLRRGCHYLDVSNELATFRDAWSLAAEAREAGVVLVPGAGFATAVVESLASHVLDRIPNADTVTIVRSSPRGVRSEGVRRTTSELLAVGNWRFRDGVLAPGPNRIADVELPEGRRSAVPIGSGEIFAVAQSTGVPNVAAYFTTRTGPVISRLAVPLARSFARARSLARARSFGPPFAAPHFASRRGAPQERRPASAPSGIWVGATNNSGGAAAGWVQGHGTETTAVIAVELARRLGASRVSGFRTSGQLLGAEYTLGLPGLEVTDS